MRKGSEAMNVDPKHKNKNHPYHDFEYDPLKGYEIPETPYSEEIANELDHIGDEENPETNEQNDQPFVDFIDSIIPPTE